ncbi:cell envelope integrity protein TolA [Salmonella enterica]|uniref:cell envelope integrity protein TolA n=1 Tax=Salmonella enterica TaxID=28901 RepID=UPI0009ACC6E0|nr:cell envelope integrity protein TolA [Salmonella enterica]
MQPKHILPLVLLLPLFLAACTNAPHTAPIKSETIPGVDDLFGNLQAGPNANIVSYAMKIKSAVEKEMYNPESYKGQVCTIRISLARDGLVSKATAESGNQELCHAALMAVKKANIPPAPDEKTWQILKNVPLDFKP